MLQTNSNLTLVNRIAAKRRCKRQSCRVYASTLRRLNSLSSLPFNQDLKWLEKDSETILKKIKKLGHINKQRNFVSSALVGFHVLGNEKLRATWNQYLKDLNQKKALESDGTLSARQKKNWLDWKTIVSLRRLLNRRVRLGKLYEQDYNRKAFRTLQQNLVISLYSFLPPVRNDYGDLRVVTEKQFQQADKSNANFLVTSKRTYKFYWAKYKTASAYGQVVIPVTQYSKPLQKLLVKHVRYLRKNFETDSLLLNARNKPMTRNGLTKFLQSLFRQFLNKNVSSTLIRQSFLTNKFSRKQLEEREQLGKAMMHSTKTQMTYVKNK